MGIILEIKAGPMAGKAFELKSGESVTIGRAEGRAQLAFPHDTFMSGVHFAVECGPQGCRVIDKKSSNGTFLNGARIKDAMLANGDEIKGGQTAFSVKIVADAKLASLMEPRDHRAVASPPPAASPQAKPADEDKPASFKSVPASPHVPLSGPQHSAPASSSADQRMEAESAGRAAPANPAHGNVPLSAPPAAPIPAKPGVSPDTRATAKLPSPAFSVMGWSFSAIPEKWQIQQEFGLQRNSEGEFPSSVVASEEVLGGISLQQFVESQISVLRGYLREPRIEPTMPPRVSGADESMAMDVRHSTKDGRELAYRRIYARSGASVGVLTVTTMAADFPQVLQSLQPLLDGAAFHSTVNN